VTFYGASSLLAASIAAAGVAANATSDRTLTVGDAMSALRALGVTKTFTAPSATWGPLILITGGRTPATWLIVHVFPSAQVAQRYNKAYPPLPASAFIHQLVPGPYEFLPRVYACNVTVASQQLPWLRSPHPSLAQRRSLARLIDEIRAAQTRVIKILRHRCGA
jgi:hypothetical protein